MLLFDLRKEQPILERKSSKKARSLGLLAYVIGVMCRVKIVVICLSFS